MKKRIFLSCLFLAASSLFSLLAKKESARLRKQIEMLSEEISKSKEKIKILSIEMEYLTQPRRVKRLSDEKMKKAMTRKKVDTKS